MTIRVLLMVSSMRGGGSEQQTLLLLKNLDRQKFSPLLYLTHRAGNLLAQVPADVPVHHFRPRRQMVYFPGRIFGQQVSDLASLLVQQRINVVYDRTFHMTLLAGPAASRAAVPRISTIVSPPHQALPMVEKRFVRIKRRRLAVAYRQSKRVIAVSHAAADSAIRYYRLNSSKVDVVPNPVDALSLRQRENCEIDLANDPSSRTCVLACVGRMTPEKGHADLIAALALLETNWQGLPIHVWMVGDGPLKPQLQMVAERTLTRHRVFFAGHQADPIAWISASDGLILPSRFEGMPNVVLEAMAIGKPVIATAAGGTAQLQADPPTMFLARPADPRCLADQISAFVQNPRQRQQHIDAASRLIQQNHDLAKTTRQIESILSQAAAS